MAETTASTAVAASAFDNDERSAMRAQSSVRFTALSGVRSSVRSSIDVQPCAETLSSLPRQLRPWRECRRGNARRIRWIGLVAGATS